MTMLNNKVATLTSSTSVCAQYYSVVFYVKLNSFFGKAQMPSKLTGMGTTNEQHKLARVRLITSDGPRGCGPVGLAFNFSEQLLAPLHLLRHPALLLLLSPAYRSALYTPSSFSALNHRSAPSVVTSYRSSHHSHPPCAESKSFLAPLILAFPMPSANVSGPPPASAVCASLQTARPVLKSVAQ